LFLGKKESFHGQKENPDILHGLRLREHRNPFPITQSYTVIPVGAFMPLLFWVLVFLSARKPTAPKPTMELFCGQCGVGVSPNFNVCPFCGVNLRKPSCPKCGKGVSVEHTFCPYCGARLTH